MSPLRKDTVMITNQGPPNSRVHRTAQKLRTGRIARFDQTSKILENSEQGEHLPSMDREL